jgi:malonate transporter
VLAPIILGVLDVTIRGRVSILNILLQPIRNPLIIAVALGVIVAVTGLKLPTPVLAPFAWPSGTSFSD